MKTLRMTLQRTHQWHSPNDR